MSREEALDYLDHVFQREGWVALQEAIAALRPQPQARALPDCEGWWWERDSVKEKWFDDPRKIFLRAMNAAPFYIAPCNVHTYCLQGRWVKANPPSPSEQAGERPDMGLDALARSLQETPEPWPASEEKKFACAEHELAELQAENERLPEHQSQLDPNKSYIVDAIQAAKAMRFNGLCDENHALHLELETLRQRLAVAEGECASFKSVVEEEAPWRAAINQLAGSVPSGTLMLRWAYERLAVAEELAKLLATAWKECDEERLKDTRPSQEVGSE